MLFRSNDTATTEIYTLSLHDALPICVTVDRLWHAVPPFPTVSEVWLHLLEAYGL